MRAYISIALLFVGAAGWAAERRPFRLNESIESPPFPSTAVTQLKTHFGRAARVIDVLGLDWWTLQNDVRLPLRTSVQLRQTLNERGLDLYLTPDEIKYYHRHRGLGPLSLGSRVDRLALGYSARVLLRRLGVTLIGQVAGWSGERMKGLGGAEKVVREIGAAVRPLNVVVRATEAERRAAELGRLDPEFIPWSQLTLPTALAHKLRALDIWNVRELKVRDRTQDLTQSSGLGPLALGQVADLLLNHGQTPAWVAAVADLDVPAQWRERLHEAGVVTKRDLRLLMADDARAHAALRDPWAVKELNRILNEPACAARLTEADRD